ncbi:hypothetical protein [Amphritea japonica]|nr:hypothetical protein [Amphritea japonica]
MKLIIVAMLPLVMCFGYYSLELIATDSLWVNILAVTALPLLLIGVGGLAWCYSDKGIKQLTLVWWGCVGVALASLVWVWG